MVTQRWNEPAELFERTRCSRSDVSIGRRCRAARDSTQRMRNVVFTIAVQVARRFWTAKALGSAAVARRLKKH